MLIELMTVMKPSNDDPIEFFKSTFKLIFSFAVWSWLCYELSDLGVGSREIIF